MHNKDISRSDPGLIILTDSSYNILPFFYSWIIYTEREYHGTHSFASKCQFPQLGIVSLVISMFVHMCV